MKKKEKEQTNNLQQINDTISLEEKFKELKEFIEKVNNKRKEVDRLNNLKASQQ